MKKILLSLTLMLSFAGLLLFDACDWMKTEIDNINHPPEPPQLIYPAPGEEVYSKSVTFTWEPALDVDGDEIFYKVFVCVFWDLECWSFHTGEGFGITSWQFDSLEPANYHWWVEADDGQEKVSSDELSFFIMPPSDTIKLSFPENEAMNVALDIRLEWEFISETNGSGITFDVYIDTNDPPSAIVAPNITELYFDPSVAPHTTYYWKVIGKGPEGDIVESDIWSYTTLNNAPEAAVLTSPANQEVGVSIDKPLEWVAAADPDGDEVSYDVYLDTNEPPTAKVGADIIDISFQQALQPNTLYYWKVISKDGYGGLAESEIWSFTTLNNIPAEVILLSPQNEATDVPLNVELKWELNSETAGYIYKYDVFLGTINPPINPVAYQWLVPFFQTVLPATNYTYYWKVIATDDHGGVVESEIWSFTTTDPSLKVNLLLPENDAIDVPLNVQLKWELSADPGGVIYEYDVYLDTNDPPTTIVITHVTEPSFWPTVLPGTTYFWKVVGKDYFSGKTVESNQWKFKTID
jgi:hypothetical protein